MLVGKTRLPHDENHLAGAPSLFVDLFAIGFRLQCVARPDGRDIFDSLAGKEPAITESEVDIGPFQAVYEKVAKCRWSDETAVF